MVTSISGTQQPHEPAEKPDTRAVSAGLRPSAATLVARLRERLVDRHHPLLVGIDGRSGVGKSTLAATVSKDLARTRNGTDHVTVIEGDDFYTGGSAEVWDHRSAAENAGLVVDWRRQRDALEQLLGCGVAEWLPFDWDADAWDGEVAPFASASTVARATSVIVLDGAYSCRPELHDLLDLRVLLEVPSDVRRRQLLDREGNAYRADWDTRWSAAEEHYFGIVMPPERFDLVLGIP